MARIRRAASLFFRVQDHGPIAVGSLLRNRLEIGRSPSVLAVSALTGEETLLSLEELEELLAIPERRWIEPSGDDPALIDALVRRGLVLTDAEDPASTELRERDDALSASGWQPYAALFHATTKWRDVTIAARPGLDERADAERAEAVLEQIGPPPPHFYEREGAPEVRGLPLARRQDGLFGVLGARRTTRAYDVDASVTEEQLSTLLDAVFGCHGTAELHGPHLALKKTSPSGGALHPIEVYPLLVDVDRVNPGLYHYRVRDHALELVKPLDAPEARSLADTFTCGQSYLAGAQAHFVLTARFGRSFWKYRRHDKAYAALLMEAGHLSQTLYLVAADLRLGAYVTAAINGANIEDELALEPLEEGAIAMCGCGVPTETPSDLEADFTPYTPSPKRERGQNRRGRTA